MEWPVFKGENQTETNKHEKMLNIASYGSNENYIKIGSHPNQKGDKQQVLERKQGVLSHGGQWTDPLLPADGQWMACKRTQLAIVETGTEILWPTPCAPQRLHSSMSQTHCTQVLTHNSRGRIRKRGLSTMEPFSHKQQQQSQVLCGTCVTGDDHVNKLSQFER